MGSTSALQCCRLSECANRTVAKGLISVVSIYFSALGATALSGAIYGYFFIKYAAVRGSWRHCHRGLANLAHRDTGGGVGGLFSYVSVVSSFTLGRPVVTCRLDQDAADRRAAKWSILFLPWV